MRFVIVTGVSGAGKTAALKMLEDANYFCVDNLPIPLLEKFASLMPEIHGEDVQNVALGIDARSGRSLAELEAVGRAAVLIPSPNVAENHQYYNAMELQKAGAAVVIEEKDLTSEKLVQTVSEMLTQPGKLAEMGRNARSLSVDDSLDRIAAALLELVKKA